MRRVVSASRPMRRATARCRGLLLVGFVIAATTATVDAKKGEGENVHRPDAECARCHTADRPTLESDPHVALDLLAPDLEARCILCHNN